MHSGYFGSRKLPVNTVLIGSAVFATTPTIVTNTQQTMLCVTSVTSSATWSAGYVAHNNYFGDTFTVNVQRRDTLRS